MKPSRHALTKETSLSADDVFSFDLDPENAAVAETERGIKAINVVDTFKVTMYGAKADGVTEDHAAINSAITAAADAGGGIVYAPAGTYLLGASLQLKDNVILRGSGWGTVFKLKNSSVAALTAIQSSTVPSIIYTDDASAVDFSLQDFAIDGNDANNSTTTFWGIGLADASQFQVRNIKVTNVYGAALGTFLSNDFSISNCFFKEITGTTGNPGEGMYIRKSYNFNISNCMGVDLDDHLVYLSGTDSETTSDGVLTNLVGVNCGRTSNSSAFNVLDGIRRITFNACHSYDSKKGFTIVGTNDAVRDITYVGCTAHNCDDATSPSGFSGSSSSGTRHTRVKMVGCKSYNSGTNPITGLPIASAVGYGFNMQDINDLTLDGCEASASNYDGVYIDTCDRVRITGRMRNNGQEPSVSNRGGVRIADCDEVYVDVMSFDNDWGIVAEASATNCLIKGYFEGNADGPYLKDANTAASVIFWNVPDTNSDVIRTRLLGTAAPTSKTWGKGDMVVNMSPDDGEQFGWVCTGGGTPGTWRSFGQVHYRSGSGSPSGSVTPNFVGEEWLDTTGNAWYKAYGTGNTDWQAL